MVKIGVVGMGNIGKVSSFILKREGYDVTIIDVNEELLKGLSLDLGVSYRKVNVLNKEELSSLSDIGLIVTALPGSIAYSAIGAIAASGHNVVDVSFFPESPEPIGRVALDKGVSVVLDAGLAPGLSNMLVSYGKELLDGITGARIYVGGISNRPDPPLGIVSTWNTLDLIDEYRRPARVINSGKVVVYDPLSSEVGKIYVKGIGELEYFPTDGLRSLLSSYPGLDFLVEYTLRWPGHVEFMKGLKRIGMLDHKEFLSSYADEFLAKLIEEHSRGMKDLVVLVVEVFNGDRGIRFTGIVNPKNDFSAMSWSTGGFLAFATMEFAKGKIGKKGLVFPEMFEKEAISDIMEMMDKYGMPIASEPI